jgi:hypothetical protein
VDSFAQALVNALALQGYQVPASVLREALALASSGAGVETRLSVDPGRQACAPVAATDVVRWSVPAAIMDDDDVYVRRFDATGYFEQATDEVLQALAAQDFRYSSEANLVSAWARAHSNEVRQFYEYLDARNQPDARTSSGLAVEISWSAAAAWILQHRRHLAGAISQEEPGSLMSRILTADGTYIDAFPAAAAG